MKAFTIRGTVVAVFCGSWQCSRCAKMNARKWAWRAINQLEIDPRPCRFWTLTMPGGMRSPWIAFESLPTMWDTLRKTMQREHKHWLYLAFVEGQAQRNGMPHFHVLTFQPAPYRLKDLATHIGFGYQAWDELVVSKQAGFYVSKYASKGDPNMPRNFRRVRASRKWADLPSAERQPYLVPARDESLTEYFDRVSEKSGMDIDDIKDRWLAFDLRQVMA